MRVKTAPHITVQRSKIKNTPPSRPLASTKTCPRFAFHTFVDFPCETTHLLGFKSSIRFGGNIKGEAGPDLDFNYFGSCEGEERDNETKKF